jgi:hypothetical protein
MPTVRQNSTKNQPRRVRKAQRVSQVSVQQTIALDDGTLTTPVALAMIQALIPLGLKAVEEALVAEVTALAGPRYARGDARPRTAGTGERDGGGDAPYLTKLWTENSKLITRNWTRGFVSQSSFE